MNRICIAYSNSSHLEARVHIEDVFFSLQCAKHLNSFAVGGTGISYFYSTQS